MDTKSITLRTIHPNLGWRFRYQRQLLSLIEEMSNSVVYWTQAQYNDAPPAVAGLAADATPSQEMNKRFKELAKKWQAKFDKAAPKISKAYLQGSYKATDSAMRAALRDAGISIKFELTPAVRDAFNASLAQNVSLISNMSEQYLTQVEGTISRSYASGFDLQKMVAEIRQHTGVMQRRAVNIAQDQSNKAHAVIERARRLEIGITRAKWRHSGGGKHPRVNHVAANDTEYDVAQGCPIKNEKGVLEYIQPGEKPFCRCVSRSVLPKFGAGEVKTVPVL